MHPPVGEEAVGSIRDHRVGVDAVLAGGQACEGGVGGHSGGASVHASRQLVGDAELANSLLGDVAARMRVSI